MSGVRQLNPTTMTRAKTFPGTSVPLGDLKDLIGDAPANADVRIAHIQPDRPFDASATTITITWSE